MGNEVTSHLRNRPRQARSAARVELLLDMAEVVFEEVGYDTATTNLVAQRAGVPVGTLYRWFPDKSAIAEALADRYLAQLLGLYDDLLGSISPEEHIGEFISRVMERLIEETRQLRALPALLVSAMVPGERSPAGRRLREGLQIHVEGLIDMRVPGLPSELRDRTSEVCVTLVHLVMASAAEDGDGTDGSASLTAEYLDVMLAYLEAKFPAADHPSWSDPDPVITPLFAAPNRATHLAASSRP